MYSDLFDALGGGAGAGMGRVPEEDTVDAAADALISFKAGKVKLTKKEDSDAYMAEPDTKRCQVHLKYNNNNQLTWEWFDRRDKAVMDTLTFTEAAKLLPVAKPGSGAAVADKDKSEGDGTDGDKEMKDGESMEESKEGEESKKDDEDESKMYYWKMGGDSYHMLWLQDKNEDPELVSKVNDILKNPTKPSPSLSSSGVTAPSPGNASTSSSSTTARQVDALSNILENLGMPQSESQNAAGGGSTDPPPASAQGGTLTLADFQGAMAGLQVQQQGAATPGLQEIVSPEAISSLLENEEVCNRLIQELPPDQRSREFLEENLRSPQVQQTLRSLTAALMPDDNGSMEGYHSVLANFQLDPEAGQQTLQQGGNPIQAFLDCVLASVKKEEEAEAKENDDEMKVEETKDEEMKE